MYMYMHTCMGCTLCTKAILCTCSIEVQAALQSELAEMTLQLDLMKEEHERAVAEVRRPLYCPAGLTASCLSSVSSQLQDRHEAEKEHNSQRHETEIRYVPHVTHHVMHHVMYHVTHHVMHHVMYHVTHHAMHIMWCIM